MTSGYTSDNSIGSNKRTRFNNDLDAPIAHNNRKSPPEPIGKTTAPADLAIWTIEAFSSSTLHHKMTHNVSVAASDFTKKYSRWFHKDKAYQNQKDNPDFISHSAKAKLILLPVNNEAHNIVRHKNCIGEMTNLIHYRRVPELYPPTYLVPSFPVRLE